MKPVFLLLLCSLIAISSMGQTVVKKIHASAQPFVRGADISNDEGDILEGKKQPKQAFVYHLYAETAKNTEIKFVSLWIKGTAYDVRSDEVKTPVILTIDEKDETLVKKTSNCVFMLSMGRLAEKAAPSATLRKLIKANELIVVYRYKGKLFYSPVKKIKLLPPSYAI